jgi:hypothetical protein
MIHSYDWLLQGGSHAGNIDHETTLIDTRDLVSHPSIPRDDDSDGVSVALDIDCGQGRRQISLYVRSHFSVAGRHVG